MHLASVRQRNVHLEEENLAAQGKKQVVNTPRRAFGDMKNTGTPGRNLLKPAASAQKPSDSIVLVDPDAENEEEYLQKLMSTSKLSDISEENEEIEFCGPEDDPDDYSYLFDVSTIF
ncbi:unnamed protein product [Cylicostephanus goldi]|uniref:Uncharacterized protein n=1 Tax=Cylicostephanus goldi TaxID=71465 RepID=A0A3P7PS37_CYLGO|nr:unnamed protein product [Cylicostephanus goldi]